MSISSLGTVVVFVGALSLLWVIDVSGALHLGVNLVVSYVLVWGLVFALSKVPSPEMRNRFTVVSTSLCVTLGALEAIAFLTPIDFRLVFGTRILEPLRDPRNRLDLELLRVRRPHLTLTISRTRGNLAVSWCLPPSSYSRHTVRYDHNGFRNDYDLATADIAVVGDSYIEAADVETSAMLTSVLARLTGLSVANLGQAGYSAQEELVVVRRYALPLRPRFIVWVFYEGNDLDETLEYDQTVAGLRRGAAVAAQPLDRSFSVNALGAAFRLLPCEPAPIAERQFGLIRDRNGQPVRLYFGDPGDAIRRTSRQKAQASEEALQRMIGILAEAHALTRREGIEFVVVYLPDPFRVYQQIAEFPSDSICVDWVVSDLPERMRRLVSGISPAIRFLDLTPRFVAEARKGRILYWPDDTHWSPDGHVVAAEAISTFLRGISSTPSRP